MSSSLSLSLSLSPSRAKYMHCLSSPPTSRAHARTLSIKVTPSRLSHSFFRTAGHTRSISLSLSESRLTSFSFTHKWYISLFGPRSTHSILSHADCLSRSVHPSRHHSFDLMVGHAHSFSLSLSLSISLSLSPYVSIDLALSRTKTIYHHVWAQFDLFTLYTLSRTLSI